MICDSFVTGGGGSKIIKNSVTYFMDGPISVDAVRSLNVAEQEFARCRDTATYATLLRKKYGLSNATSRQHHDVF